MKNEEGYPFMHGAGRAVLDGDMAVRIAQFLLHLYSNKRPGFTQLKADYKAALDTVCRSIDQPSLSSKQALAFEVNAGACDNYLREYIDPLKFLNCVKGHLTLTSIPLTPEGVDIEGIYVLYINLHRSLLYAGTHPSQPIPRTGEKQPQWWRGRSHLGY